MSDRERIVCKWLRKLCPSREWDYLGEVEHYWIGEMCDEIVALERDRQETPTVPSDGRVTDEVRRDIDACTQSGEMFDTVFIVKSALLCDLDRIDAEHERQMADAFETRNSDENLENDGFVRLPKDADGKYIHVGDELVDKDDKSLKPAIVKCILYNDEGCVVSHLDPHGCWYDPSFLRHHHAPTVEDVLTEFAAKLIERGELTNGAAQTIAEYAKRLRLREGDES